MLDWLAELKWMPTRAVPLADGGVALLLSTRPHYVALEFDNDGEVIGAFSDRLQRHHAWEITWAQDSLEQALRRFRELAHE